MVFAGRRQFVEGMRNREQSCGQRRVPMMVETTQRVPENVGDFLVESAPGAQACQLGGRSRRTSDQRAGVMDERGLFQGLQLHTCEAHIDAKLAGISRDAAAVRCDRGSPQIQSFEQRVQRSDRCCEHDRPLPTPLMGLTGFPFLLAKWDEQTPYQVHWLRVWTCFWRLTAQPGS